MNFVQAIRSGFQNYFTFRGRAQRSAYWYWVLFILIVQIFLLLVIPAELLNVVSTIFGLATFFPSLSVAVRRLHDFDRSGWWVLLSLIPLIGLIAMIYWGCRKGTTGPNRFGPDPLAVPLDTAPAADA